MSKGAGHTFGNVLNLDVAGLAPRDHNSFLIILERFNGDDQLERRQFRSYCQEEGNVFGRGIDDRQLCVVDPA